MSPAQIENYVANKSVLQFKIINKLFEMYGISPNWLLYGIGPKKLDSAEIAAGPEYIEVPLLSGRVSAGPAGEIISGDITNSYPFKRTWIERLVGGRVRDLYLIQVRGESMCPTVNQGELAMVDTGESERLNVRNGAIYLVILPDGGVALKRLLLNETGGKFKLICLSDNPSYKTFEINLAPGESLKRHILGRVRWAGREFE